MGFDGIKRLFQSFSWIDAVWGLKRRIELQSSYRRRREAYWKKVEKLPPWTQQDIQREVRQRLKERGYHPSLRLPGQVHTFAFIPRMGWHGDLYPDLHELGSVSWYDYTQYGYTWSEFRRGDRRAVGRRREMLNHFFHLLVETHQQRPIDWLFVYASGVEITADTLRRIEETLGIPTVNMCLDDKQSWVGPLVDGCHFGQIDLAKVFDLNWSSARVACDWYRAEGGRPIYLPEGFDSRRFRPMRVSKDIPVSFIGDAYGFRRRWAAGLRRYGINVRCFGRGWNEGPVWGDQMVEIINRSIINLGTGGIGYSEDLTNVKVRDFEIPGTGGGMYLTTYNADLAQHFHVGHEIACYHSQDELVEQVRYYLRHVDEAIAMADRARRRCLKEHRWVHRYQTICRLIGILKSPSQEEQIDAGSNYVSCAQW